MLFHQLCHCALLYGIHRKSHCKQTVCVLAKSLSVKKVSPYTYYLSAEQSHTYNICHFPEWRSAEPAEESCHKHAPQNCSINRDTATAYITQDLPGFTTELTPWKSNVIKPASDHSTDQCRDWRPQAEIQIQFLPSGAEKNHPQPNKQTYSHQYPVYCDIKSKNRKSSVLIFKQKPQIRKSYCYLHKTPLSYTSYYRICCTETDIPLRLSIFIHWIWTGSHLHPVRCILYLPYGQVLFLLHLHKNHSPEDPDNSQPLLW